MKLFFALLFFIVFQQTSYAFEALVIVLEAPLLSKPQLNSTVLQTVRKGSLVYIPTEIGNLLSQGSDLPPFIQTYDRVGNIAYIPTKYIKIITSEESEKKMPVIFPGHDPTDYRIEEPIPKTYPFTDNSFVRSSLSITLGNNLKTPYEYHSVFSTQSLTNELGLKWALSRKITFDRYDRYYFGLISAFTMSDNSIEFKNNQSAKENLSILKFGPLITLDAYKTEQTRFTIGTGFTYNYHKNNVTVYDAQGTSENRKFTGFSLSPFSTIMIQWSEVFPKIDFITGADFNLFLPYIQKTTDPIATNSLWNSPSSDRIDSGPKYQIAFFLGLQARY